MKLALIPPHCMNRTMEMTDYHLFLPQLFRDEGYALTVQRIQAGPDYTILDNGVAEGEDWHPEALHAIANQFGIQEIVVPDVMGNYEQTVLSAHDFQKYIQADKRYMGVVQGQSIEQVIKCIQDFAEFPYITTLGIPRHLCKTLGDRDARLVISGMVFDSFDQRFDIHLLGASPLWPKELLFAQVAYGDEIRGMDTSMPYVYGYHGESVDGEMHLMRPDDYFNKSIDAFDPDITLDNINLMTAWSKEASSNDCPE